MPPQPGRHGDVCIVPVYSTSGPADGSETARVILDALRKCSHMGVPSPPPLDPETAAQLAGGVLATVARLIEAARSLLAKEQAQMESSLLIEAALGKSDTDLDAVEVEARELEGLAAIEDSRGLAAAAQAGAGDPWPPVDGARELYGLASERLSAANDLVASAEGAEDGEKLAAERDRLAVLLMVLSTQLEVHR